MKKNTMMRLASALLVLVLLTTCAISGTFAKYTSTTTVTDSARVAYWGWGKTAQLNFDLFSTEYDAAGGTVKSADTDNVIAPGTSQETAFTFAYVANTSDAVAAPEVDYIFDVAVTISGTTTKLDANPSFVWTLDGNEYDTVADLKAAIEALEVNANPVDGKAANYYKNGTLPAGFGASSQHTVGWAWEFEGQDGLDTELGNMDPLENVAITITVTATQQD